MVQFLTFLSTLVNLIGLAVSLCLGFYIVTRTPRSRLSWLAALTLWSLTCFFLHNTMAIHVPGSGVLPWLRPATMFALPLGFHLILLLPPGKEPSRLDFYLPAYRLPGRVRGWLGRLAPGLCRSVVPLTYGLSLLLVIGGVYPFPIGTPSPSASGPVIWLSDQSRGPLHPLSLVYLFVLGGLALLHLWSGWKGTPGPRCRRPYRPLFAAVLLTCLGGLYLGLGIWLQLRIPSVPGDLAVGLAAVLASYTVAQHNARLAGIAIRRDLRYIAVVIGSFTLFYVLIAEVLYVGGHIFSPLTLILIILVAVSSLMLYDGLRTTVDRLFYRDQFRQLRANLRALAQEAGIGQTLPERLDALLGALCRAFGIREGLIALREGEEFVCRATERAAPVGQAFAAPLLAADEPVDLPRPEDGEFQGMALLVPLYDGDDQIGALVLGPKEAGRPYSEADLMLLDDLADQVVAIIRVTRLQEANAQAISEMVAEFREQEHALQRQMQQMVAEREQEVRPIVEGIGDAEWAGLVEDALRHLYDYPYLGEQDLARLRVVDWQLAGQDADFVTHIDCGKALSEVLVQAMNKLRPEGAEPNPQAIPPREWQQYTILHEAYALGELNRDIMSKLYISEGTFNRTRRRAVRSVAKALREMEGEAQQRTSS